MKSEELMLKVENVSKIYRLGEIGGTTLKDELNRLKAKILHRDDPTKKIGEKNYCKGEKFKALDNVSFEVKKGERIGIIGHNGAGKSTLLKLISRVTGPSEGKIHLNGRIASMLEVGTGFHPELTGRENVYMNGAILGMTKKEIDAKMEDIIEFSEVRQFIDTPVKRYSSGMYVKLAFSVAAHLDSEIMIMDEVLAVGDMAFQNKCLKKMKDVSEESNKTILYVSHNMNTIKELCEKVIVLNKGKIIFFGDVDDGINIYLNISAIKTKHNDLSGFYRHLGTASCFVKMEHLELLNNDNVVCNKEGLKFKLSIFCNVDISNVKYRFIFKQISGVPVGTSVTNRDFSYKSNRHYDETFFFSFPFFAPGRYTLQIVVFSPDKVGNQIRHDYVENALFFDIANGGEFDNMVWQGKSWGSIVVPPPIIL